MLVKAVLHPLVMSFFNVRESHYIFLCIDFVDCLPVCAFRKYDLCKIVFFFHDVLSISNDLRQYAFFILSSFLYLLVVPNMPQQRPDQHHPPGTSTMMHPATAAGPPIVAQNPAYSTQYFTCSPQQFASQPLVQQMPHYQSQVQ